MACMIVIADYDPRWPELYRREAERIRSALADRALRIEHAGSTSVPGLAAKPVIDIVLMVADSTSAKAGKKTRLSTRRERVFGAS